MPMARRLNVVAKWGALIKSSNKEFASRTARLENDAAARGAPIKSPNKEFVRHMAQW